MIGQVCIMYDIVIKNGLVFNGLDKEGENIDLGIKNGKIQIIASSQKAQGKEEINAENRYICPGFIDIQGSFNYASLIMESGKSENFSDPTCRDIELIRANSEEAGQYNNVRYIAFEQ